MPEISQANKKQYTKEELMELFEMKINTCPEFAAQMNASSMTEKEKEIIVEISLLIMPFESEKRLELLLNQYDQGEIIPAISRETEVLQHDTDTDTNTTTNHNCQRSS